ncbi:A/G-specific adenine glycosylase [Rhodovarius crocodyli]|nr:NUDIX domain-containing protein [Rhodovarius crocodyli]
MLQQTTVATVGPRYARFLARFPTVEALAEAEWSAVAEEWAGLGYYARARNLHAAAKAVAGRGGFPRTAAALRELPGIGAYTSAAVAAIAFHEPVLPVDGNVERVMARLAAVETPLPAARPLLGRLAGGFMADPAARAVPGDFAQALFDLGATICTPRNPACALCPWMAHCRARKQGIQAELPVKPARKARPVLHGVHFLLRDASGAIGVRLRPAEGLFGGMWELPGTPWRDTPWSASEAMPHAPAQGVNWREADGLASHALTHRELALRLLVGRVAALPPGLTALGNEAGMPTVMRKLLALE